MRSHGYGRGKPIHKPKKSAADFAREDELQKDQDKKNEGEATPEFESERYSGKLKKFYVFFCLSGWCFIIFM